MTYFGECYVRFSKKKQIAGSRKAYPAEQNFENRAKLKNNKMAYVRLN